MKSRERERVYPVEFAERSEASIPLGGGKRYFPKIVAFSSLAVFLVCVVVAAGVFLLPGITQAANCGGAVVCVCGDTVTSNTILTSNLTCTGQGLVVGANSITIDGGNHTITGDGGGNDYGINNSSGYDSIVIQNLSITNFNRGIYFNNTITSIIQNITANSNGTGIYFNLSSSNTITGNTANSNGYGMYLDSSSNTLTNNTANSNIESGIYITSSASNTLIGNTANLNSHGFYLLLSDLNTLTNNTANSNNYAGIYLDFSTSNTLTNNTMSSNRFNINIGDDYSGTYFDNTIDTTNKVEGKSVYYFYNNDGTAENPIIYDGNVLGDDIGMFWCISCEYVQIKNATLSVNNYAGVFFNNTTFSTIYNITANLNTNYGIYLLLSDLNTLTNNTTSSNTDSGIYLISSSSNTLTGNTANSNNYGISLNSSSNTLTNNTMSSNWQDFYNDGTSILSSNQFKHNMSSKMLFFTETTRTKNINASVNFDISMFDLNGSTCPNCSYTITTSPSETVSSSKNSNQVTGSFTATKSGTYSLIFTIIDPNSNTTQRRMLFFVGSVDSQTTKYYFRGIDPTHSQSKGRDVGSLFLTTPTSSEEWACAQWLQNSPDELPSYPLANLSSIDTYSWYKQLLTNGAYIGVQRRSTYDTTTDFSSSVIAATNYTWVNRNFTNLNWIMDYPYAWYWTTLKLRGTSTRWTTFPTGYENQPSYADFTHQYTTTPSVRSISNENIYVLSATADPSATSNVSVILENSLASATSTNLTLAGLQRPFLGATSTIYSTSTTTITTPSISANATSTFNSVPMDITPSSGSIDVVINTWNTSGTYYKKWTEVGSGVGTASHTIGDLKSNTLYTVKVGEILYGNYTSNSSGQITFTYSGGYSTKTFEVLEDIDAPIETTLSLGNITISSITATVSGATDANAGLHATPYYFDRDAGTAISDWQAGTTWADSGLTSNTEYSYKVKARDAATSPNVSVFTATQSKYTSAPTPTNLAANTVGQTAITLSVDAINNPTADSSGYYFANTTNSTNSGWIQTNTWQDTSLTCGTSYDYTIKYRNGDGTETDTLALTQATANCSAAEEDDDTEDLDISDIDYDSTENTITIKWKTNNKADSKVEYGTDIDMDQDKEDDDNEKNHKIVLKNLDSDTLYYFKIKSEDENGSEDSSDRKSIRTEKQNAVSGFVNNFFGSVDNNESEGGENSENNTEEKNIIDQVNEIPEKIQEKLAETRFFNTDVFKKDTKKYLSEVKFQLKDEMDNPLSNLNITLYSDPKTTTTDENGYATFKEVEIGRHNLVFNYQNANRRFAVNIQEPATENGEVQMETVVIRVGEKPSTWIYYLAGALGIAIIVLIFKRKRKTS